MIKQGIILLAAAAACLALGDGRGYHSKKNTFQAPSQYSSVAEFHSNKQTHAPAAAQPEPQRAPSPYAFNYEADGSARQETGDASGKVSGSYKVTNEDGSVRVVKYVADENGFRADIDTNEPGTKSDNPADVTLKSAAVEKKYVAPAKFAAQAPVKYAAQGYSTKNAMYEQKPIQFNLGNSGGAYSYNYETKLEDGGSNAHSESSDGSGRVTGFYSMSAADGRRRKVDYSADGAGFNAAVDTNEFGTKSDSPAHVQFISSAPQQGPPAPSGYEQAPSFRQQQKVTQYSAPAYQQAPIQQTQFSDSKPSPYAFSYDAQLEDGSSSRQESADASGKVTGSYSLATADGRKRLIKYTADHDGFRASVDTNEFGTKSDSPANVEFHSSAPKEAPAAPQTFSAPVQRAPMSYAAQQTKINSGSGIKSRFQAPAMSYQGQSSIQYDSTANERPSPYSFEYAADLEDGSVSRSESADESGKVVGSYSLSVADGRQRKVDYFADQGGFRATVNTNEFGTKADSPADVQFYSTATFDEPAPYSSPNAYRPSSSSSASMYSAPAIAQQPIQSPIQFNMGAGNGAYSYNYQTSLEDGGNSAHAESSDGSGKVSGYYSMSIPDGRRRKVDYTADSAGFQASVDTNEFGTKSDSPAHVSFLSSAPQPAPEAARAPVAFKASAASQFSAPKASGSVDMYKTSYISQQKVEPVQTYQPSPYAFNYEAEASGGSSSRKESSDASGTVTGSYEVRNADGSVRVVEYIADKDGFRANVKTNEQGTKSDNPADVTVKSDAPSAPVQAHSPVRQTPVQQSPIHDASFPARTYTQKTSQISQKHVDPWRR